MSPHQGTLRKAGMFSAGLKCKKPSHQGGLRMAVCIDAFLVANPLLHHIIDQCLAWLVQILRGISADFAGLGTGAQATDGCSADSLAGGKSAS